VSAFGFGSGKDDGRLNDLATDDDGVELGDSCADAALTLS
jgi:hypothetical protein